MQRHCHSSSSYRSRFVRERFIILFFNSYAPASVSKLISRAIFRWIPNTRAVWTINGIVSRVFTLVRLRMDFLDPMPLWGNDLEHAAAENNHLTSSTQWYTLVEPDNDKSSISASISVVARLAVHHATKSSSFQVSHFSRERKLFSSRITHIFGLKFLSPRITDFSISEQPCNIKQITLWLREGKNFL